MTNFLSRLLRRNDNQSALQEQVDAIAREEQDRREYRLAQEPNEERIWTRPQFEEIAASEFDQAPDSGETIVVGGLLRTLLNTAGLGNLTKLASGNNPWMSQINQITQSLSPESRDRAIAKALINLSAESKATLEERLRTHSVGTGVGLDGELQAALGEHDGLLKLLSRVAPEQSHHSGSDASIDVMSIVRDPAIRDLAKKLLPEMYREKQGIG